MNIKDSFIEKIKILENSIIMYENTRNEMLEHGVDVETLIKVDDEISKLKGDFDFYKGLVYKMDNPSEKCNCNGYTEGCTNPHCKSRDFEIDNGYVFYKKKDEDKLMNSDEYDKEIKQIKTLIDKFDLKDDELLPIMSNKFLVKFPEDIPLESKDVLSIYTNDYSLNKTNFSLYITFREFEKKNFCLPYLLTKLINNKVKFNLIVETLNPKLEVIYVTEYTDVMVSSFGDADRNYESDDVNKYNVKCVFENVKYYIPNEYEASSKEK